MADHQADGDEHIETDPKEIKYLQAILQEKKQLGPNMEIASRLLQEEIDKVKAGRYKVEQRYVDVFHGRGTRIVSRVMVPVKEYPKFNFVGKLLGPKGNTLRRLQEETKCKMAILGRGSMKDKAKEDELRNGLDPKYAHLTEDLHVEVVAIAPPAQAHARVAYALAELRKYLIPDVNDEISTQQYQEMENYYDGQEDDDYAPPVSAPRDPPQFSRGRGAGGMGGGGRGGRPNVSRPSGPPGASYGGGLERSAPQSQRGGFNTGGRGRGAPRGVGGRGGGMAAPRRPMNDDSFYDNGMSNSQSRGGYGGGGNVTNDFGNSDFQRRVPDEGPGAWKQRGGISRFSDRSVPYSRRT